MKTALRYMVVISVAAVLVVSGVYLLSGFQNSNARLSEPENFIPSDSVFYAMVSSGNTSYYPFVVDGSIGAVVQASFSSIASGNLSSKISLSSPKVSAGTSYDGFSVFSISNVDLLTLFNFGINNSLMHLLDPVLNLSFLSSVRNSTIYASNPSSSLTVIGQLQALQLSLNSFTGSAGISQSALALPGDANLSIHYTGHGSGITYVGLNLTQSNISAKIGMVSPFMTMAIYTASLEIHVNGLRFEMLSPSTLFILISSESAAVKAMIENLTHYLGLITL